MTATHARTPNEQLIAVLECQVATMRGALDSASLFVNDLGCTDDKCEHPECLAKKQIRAALSTSTEYANKVVVDREEMEILNQFTMTGHDCLDHVSYDPQCTPNCERCRLHVRLDSLRKQGGGARCKVCGSTENIERGLCDDHEILSRTELAP